MARILAVFNRYVYPGGEEMIVDRICRHLSDDHEMASCSFDSRDWIGARSPRRLTQLRRTFYNWDSRESFEKAVRAFRPDVALFHNVFPVGSPSLYHSAQCLGLPVIQYAHSFRPFSVGGTLHASGRLIEESLHGNYWREVWYGAWQASVVKSAAMALVLRRLHASGWLGCVKAWICVSDFLRDKFVSAGLPREQVFALRHSWDAALLEPGPPQDDGYYLFLGRLVDIKGVSVLLNAWRMLQTRLGDRTPWLQIGGEGPLDGLVREAAACGLRVRALGWIATAAKATALRRCRAVIAPSTCWEALGLVTYEAYDVGKPMLAARSGGLTETVQHGVTGLLHEPGNAQALAADVLRMEAMGAQLREGMGLRGRAWLLEHADVTHWKHRFAAVLSKVISGGEGRIVTGSHPVADANRQRWNTPPTSCPY
jgi:glycosyltransferase involved in cell wall biosynthesis